VGHLIFPDFNWQFLTCGLYELGSFLKCIPAIVHRDLTTASSPMDGEFDFSKGWEGGWGIPLIDALSSISTWRCSYPLKVWVFESLATGCSALLHNTWHYCMETLYATYCIVTSWCCRSASHEVIQVRVRMTSLISNPLCFLGAKHRWPYMLHCNRCASIKFDILVRIG